ncbi:MAG: hypothetical protein WC737_05740 [Parcubacteria group bacterium]|jgi:hypothetical protein
MTDFTRKDRLANIGYLLIGKETTKGTPVIPTVAIPMYEESLSTNINLDMDSPIMGNRFARYFNFKGQRDHQGTIKVLCEPKTLPHFLNMLLKKGTTTVSGSVYTHPFTLDNDTPVSKSYTIEILKGDVVFRYSGVEISKIAPIFEENTLKLELTVSALSQFSVAPISTASGSAANNVTLATDYDDAPNKGIVAGDTLVLVKVTGATSDTYEEVVVSAVNANGTQITTGAIVGTYAAGDYCYIKKQTPTYTLGEPLKWSGTQFRFGATAAAALTAIQENVEKGSSFEIIHEFEAPEGAKRSGSVDPAALVRKQGDMTVKIKKSFNDYKEYERFISISKRALVIRILGAIISGSDRNELRITINNMKLKTSPVPLTTGEIIYLDQDYSPQFDASDAQGMAVTVINDVAAATYN